MHKRVVIVHGWDGYPEEGWFPWLQNELEAKGFKVVVPTMPEPAAPDIGKWVSYLANIVGEVDENTYFIGHSIGCQAILRYLETIHGKKIGGAVFVAGWFILSDLETEEEKIIGKPWVETQMDFDKIKAITTNFVAIFSEDDPVVPFEENKKLFEDKIGAKIIIDNNKGHFSASDNINSLPSALQAVLELTKK